MTNAIKFHNAEWLAEGRHEELVFSKLPEWMQQQVREGRFDFVTSNTDYVILTINKDNMTSKMADFHEDPDHILPGDWLCNMEDGSLFILKESRVRAVPERHREMALETLQEAKSISKGFLDALFPVNQNEVVV